MRERPILFSGPMVRAILAGTKTQTRRPVKPQPAYPDAFDSCTFIPGSGFVDIYLPEAVLPAHHWHCRLGKPGDHLWVRETLRGDGQPGNRRGGIMRYGADGEMVLAGDSDHLWPHLRPALPSIHMPRWACRLVLEIVSVRVERVHEIGEADCWAEGLEEMDGHFGNAELCAAAKRHGEMIESARPMYSLLWDSIYAAKGQGWDANPWVWVVEFKRAEVPHA